MAIPHKLLDAFTILAAQPERAMARAELARCLGRSEKQLRRMFRAYNQYRANAPLTLPMGLPALEQWMRDGRKWWQVGVPTPPATRSLALGLSADPARAVLAIDPSTDAETRARAMSLNPVDDADRRLVTHVALPRGTVGARWVLSWGSSAELLRPSDVRATIADEVARLAALYEIGSAR